MQKLDLSKMITPEEVHKIAKETKFVQRSGGKIDPFDFFMTLVFRMATSIPPQPSEIHKFSRIFSNENVHLTVGMPSRLDSQEWSMSYRKM